MFYIWLLIAFTGLSYSRPSPASDHIESGPPSWSHCPPTPQNPTFKPNPHLPDPFTFLDGEPVTSFSQWGCRQREIAELFQKYELGYKPAKPSMSTTFSNNTLSITCTVSANSISFDATITYPPSGHAPYPALIGLDGGSLPQPSNVALVSFSSSDIAQQDNTTSRGVGKFYDLYGRDASAGALMAYAWAVSRIVDAISSTPAAQMNPHRLGVTGCSRDGKGALVAGAFDPRIALTLPQESGSGGTDCWRVSDALFAQGDATQTAHEIVTENVWFAASFDYFAANRTPLLPFDHHQLAGLVAPRALLSFENWGYDWLGAPSAYACLTAAKTVYAALGVAGNVGYSVAANHTHCQFPAEQQGDLDAFVGRFLLDMPEDTEIARWDGRFDYENVTLDNGYWDDWAVPDLRQ